MTDSTEKLKNIQEFNAQDTKKFVFQIYDDNIDFIESIPPEKKNFLINQLIQDYRTGETGEKKKKDLVSILKKTGVAILLAVIGVPLFIMLINFSFNITVNSYAQMQKNFEKLF